MYHHGPSTAHFCELDFNFNLGDSQTNGLVSYLIGGFVTYHQLMSVDEISH